MKFQKGHPGYKPKGRKNNATLLKEERRAIFEAEMSKLFLEKIRSARPEYLLDQFIGKAPDKIEHSGEIKTDNEITQEVIALAKEELKKRMKEDGE